MKHQTFPRQPEGVSGAVLFGFPTDIAAENTRAVLRAALHHKLSAISGPWCCYGCDASRLFEIDECPDCGEQTSAYPAGEAL